MAAAAAVGRLVIVSTDGRGRLSAKWLLPAQPANRPIAGLRSGRAVVIVVHMEDTLNSSNPSGRPSASWQLDVDRGLTLTWKVEIMNESTDPAEDFALAS